MTIKEGYDGKPTDIRVRAREDSVELWIEQYDVREGASSNDRHETLAFMSIEDVLRGWYRSYPAYRGGKDEGLVVSADERDRAKLLIQTAVNEIAKTLGVVL